MVAEKNEAFADAIPALARHNQGVFSRGEFQAVGPWQKSRENRQG